MISPHLDPSLGYPAIGASVLIGISILVWGHSEHHLRTWGQKLLPLGVMVIGLVFYGIGGFWYYKLHSPASTLNSANRALQATIPSEQHNPKVGALRLVAPTLRVDLFSSKGEVTAQVQAQMINDSDRLIQFHATTAGNINGIWFDFNKVEFDGYAQPHQQFYLLSAKIKEIKPPPDTDQNFLQVVAIYEYKLDYKFVSESSFSRTTEKGIRIEQDVPMRIGKRGDIKTVPFICSFYNEHER